LIVRAQGTECADWRHIARTYTPGIPGVTSGSTEVTCTPPERPGVYDPAPLAAQSRSARALGFTCAEARSDETVCRYSVRGRAVESTLGVLAHPRPPSVAVDFRADFEVHLHSNGLPLVTCRTWQRSSPPGAYQIVQSEGEVGVTPADQPTTW